MTLIHFTRLTKKQRKFVKKGNALLRKRCPKAIYKSLFAISLREMYPLMDDTGYMPWVVFGLVQNHLLHQGYQPKQWS